MPLTNPCKHGKSLLKINCAKQKQKEIICVYLASVKYLSQLDAKCTIHKTDLIEICTDVCTQCVYACVCVLVINLIMKWIIDSSTKLDRLKLYCLTKLT